MVGKNIAVFAATLLMALAVPAMAQNNGGGGQQGGGPGGGGQGGGGPGGRGNFDPAQFRQRQMDQLKQQLGATDDEFAAMQPKIEAVQTLQRDLNGGRFGMFGGNRPRRNNGGGPGGNPQGGPGATTQPSGVQGAMADLETTLNDQSAGADVIKTKLDALREARTKAKQDLAQAQADLKTILTQRQEAVLVLRGYLD